MRDLIIGEKTCYNTEKQQIELAIPYFQTQLLELSIESVVMHEILHDVLFRLFGEKVCCQLDNIAEEVE